MKRLPVFFISHGGGPWPYMPELKSKEGGAYAELETSLRSIPQSLPEKPRAILMISGHWEAPAFSVMASAQPPMVYDYFGFPEHTYHVQYSAPGNPKLALEVQRLMSEAGIPCVADRERGFDHGTFVPLAVMYPEADIPVIQLSLKEDYHPDTHWKVGRALAPLREQGVLIIGSGLTYHNLRLFDGRARRAQGVSGAFDEWLAKAMSSDPQTRYEQLMHWEAAPFARLAHPQEDHLIPLLVALGAAESEKSEQIYHEARFMGGISVSSYRIG